MQEQSDQAPTDSNADAAAVDSNTAAATADSPLAAGLPAQGTPSAAENSGGTPAAATEEVSVFLIQAVFIVGMACVLKLPRWQPIQIVVDIFSVACVFAIFLLNLVLLTPHNGCICCDAGTV